jgi:iron(III) transport system substrate-binding protein
MRQLIVSAALAVAINLGAACAAEAPALDASSVERLAAARREGALRIASTTDEGEVAELLDDFRALYRGIEVAYDDRNSTEIYERFLAEQAAGAGTADLLWSSAMDLQLKLVNDGHAQPHASANLPNLPSWAVWKNEAFGVTAEPVAMVYNKRLLAAADVPQTHADLIRLLATKPDALKGKIGTYDPERSSVGFLFITQDVQVTERSWTLVHAMGQAGLKLYTSTGAMLDRVAAGEHVLAYDVIGSYAIERAKREPQLGVVLPADYTLIVSRVAFIPKTARHPNTAKLFLDFLLSERGQRHLAAHSIGAVRDDVPNAPEALATREAARPIRVGPELLAYLDQAKRARFLRDWRRALAGEAAR